MKTWEPIIILIVVVGLFAIASSLFIWDELTDELEPADVGLLLGDQVLPSGNSSAGILRFANGW
jgi:hypothetical protein